MSPLIMPTITIFNNSTQVLIKWNATLPLAFLKRLLGHCNDLLLKEIAGKAAVMKWHKKKRSFEKRLTVEVGDGALQLSQQNK